ncbi:hypothetical protein [Prosthecobacter sp.]|uniref:hypothetical protein n=1 Tax=Prosthecobacter sp. TaxID=1965333 RepID=UPI003784A119
MNKPDHRKSRLRVDVSMMVMIMAGTFCILIAGGHGGGFLWQYFAERPADIICSPFGQPFLAALLLPVSSLVSLKGSTILRWLALLLLTGFFIFLGLKRENVEVAWITTAPLQIIFFIQFARTIDPQQLPPTPAP